MGGAGAKYELLPTSVSAASPAGPAPHRRLAASTARSLGLALCVAAFLVFWLARWPAQSAPQDRVPPDANVRPPAMRVVRRFELSAYAIRNVEKATVSLAYGDGSAAASDWIGVYCLENEDAELPVGEYIDRRATSGRASDEIEFGPLVNMRCALQFKLLAADGSVLATAPSLVRFRQGHAEPTQLHLAMTTSPSEMRVMWTSADVTADRPRVRFGSRADQLLREAAATWTTYDADDMCAAPATTRGPREFRDPGLLYEAVMTGLEPDVTYYYQVGSGSGDKWSEVRTFRLPPLRGVPIEDKPLSLFVFGDLMTATDATKDFRIPGGCGTTMELIEKDLLHPEDGRDYVGLIHVGDLSYAAGKTYVWDHFGALIEPVASRIPYMVSIGNHDFGYLEGRASKKDRAPPHTIFDWDETKGFDAHGECGVPTEKRFHMPDNGNGILWYSFDVGLTHHTILSGEHDFVVGSPMHNWLLNDLKGVDRTKTPWLFVHLHRPLYCSVAFGGDFIRSLYLRDHLEKAFAEYRVDVVFSGHYHSYERTCPVYDDQCYYGKNGEVRGPVHIMVGSGGANVDTFGYYRVGWSEYAKMTYGYGRLHVFNVSHALFEFIENDARRVTDSMWIVTDHKWSLHEQWRWRRVVFHPSLSFVITTAVLGLIALLWYGLRRRFRHHVAKRSENVKP